MSTEYQKKIKRIQRELGIPDDYAQARGLVLVSECSSLQGAGKDIFDREQQMDVDTLRHWQLMRNTALEAGIELQLVSAFRSADYQHKLFLKKLDAGQSIEDILQVNAAPGYSEHHSGQALDLSSPGAECLEESFESTAAFDWLSKHAAEYSFRLSFPKNNPQGFLYEPWHWFYQKN